MSSDLNDDYPAIEDLAAIGNGHSVALISRTGTIEWWCPVRFDHPPVFASILDRRAGGRCDIRIDDIERIERSYIEHTNVLRTIFKTSTGALELIDFMPVVGDADDLRPHHALVRNIRCIGGTVDVLMTCAPRFRHGRVAPRPRRVTSDAVRLEAGTESLVVRSGAPIELQEDSVTIHCQIAHENEVWLGLSYSESDPIILPPLNSTATALRDETIEFWQSWASRCRYGGPYRDAVLRSALALKMMLFAPSGALVAAPTTSLPEDIGGVRNWDYRYCWLRDASLAIRALLILGYTEEAGAYMGWILHATYLTWPKLQVLYDVYGRSNVRERELPQLEGYRRSAPVRIGNEAQTQLQSDVYGEVIGAAHDYVMSGGALAKGQLRRLVQLGEMVVEIWPQPDDGIWEIRSQPRHYVHSKVMCWRALDNLLTMHEHGHLRVPVERFRRVRDRIRDDVEANGFDRSVSSYVQAYGETTADASCLMLPLHSYIDAADIRMQNTFAFLKERLEVNGLWYRYPPGSGDGLPGREGTFGMCSFLAADVLARAGKIDQARRQFEHVLKVASDVGLFAEQIDEASGSALGNYPQAFTHIGLINAAHSIQEAMKK